MEHCHLVKIYRSERKPFSPKERAKRRGASMSTGGGGEKVGGGGSGSAKTPSDFLKSIRGRPVVVKLNSGVDYRGPSSLILYSRLRFVDLFFCLRVGLTSLPNRIIC